jgi:hypothetical protein
VAEPGGVVLHSRAQDLTGMAQLLAGLGWAFTVRAPAELRDEVGRYVQRLAAYASRR